MIIYNKWILNNIPSGYIKVETHFKSGYKRVSSFSIFPINRPTFWKLRLIHIIKKAKILNYYISIDINNMYTHII